VSIVALEADEVLRLMNPPWTPITWWEWMYP